MKTRSLDSYAWLLVFLSFAGWTACLAADTNALSTPQPGVLVPITGGSSNPPVALHSPHKPMPGKMNPVRLAFATNQPVSAGGVIVGKIPTRLETETSSAPGKSVAVNNGLNLDAGTIHSQLKTQPDQSPGPSKKNPSAQPNQAGHMRSPDIMPGQPTISTTNTVREPSPIN
jgi:hypothetical protein